MRVLILTGKFGMGHYSVAEALKQEIEREEKEAYVEIVDLVEYMFPRSSKIIYKTFNFLVTKCSGIYNMLNNVASKHSDVPMKKNLAKRMEGLINKHKPDIVLSTFPGCSQYISAYIERSGAPISLYTYITDLTVHEEWIAESTDLYFVGSENTKNVLISMGISEDIIRVSGIPVRENFHHENSVRGKNSGRKKILIMGGGLGLLPKTDEVLRRLSSEKELDITVITGNNRELKNKLERDYPHMRIIGYTNEVDKYMKEADLILTKSGGITTFEAIYSETPMYIVTPFLSQEVGNAQYIEQKCIGKVAWDRKGDISADLMSLINNKQLLEKMRKNMGKAKMEFEPTSPVKAFRNVKRKVS